MRMKVVIAFILYMIVLLVLDAIYFPADLFNYFKNRNN
jgi:hypothetical protein